MTLAEQYLRQYRWRPWSQAYEALPRVAGARVLDLGCAVGDQSRDLAALGAEVLGIDADEELLACARSRQIAGARFERGDVRAPVVDGTFDGIWASFLSAYIPDLVPVLCRWRELLRPGGWIALTEVSGLFDHAPLAASARSFLDNFVREACDAGRYDFSMGGKLARHVVAAGFRVEVDRTLPDRELCFDGAAEPDVFAAWTQRFARMRALQERARHICPSFQDEFLRCLASPAHTTGCRVHFCVARRG